MLDLLGVKIVFVSKGIKEVIKKLKNYTDQAKHVVMTCQLENKINIKIHKKTTVKEITKSMKNIDYFISGMGTGGTITGVGEVLKKKKEFKYFDCCSWALKGFYFIRQTGSISWDTRYRCWFSSKNFKY